MRFSPIAALKSLRRAIRRRRFIRLRRLAATRRDVRAALDAAAWDDDTIRQQVAGLAQQNSLMSIDLGAAIWKLRQHEDTIRDLVARVGELEQRFGVAEPVAFELDLSAIAKG